MSTVRGCAAVDTGHRLGRALRKRANALAFVAAAALSSGCSSLEADVYNLDAMHHPDGSFRRRAPRLNALQYFLRFQLAGFTSNPDRYRAPDPERIDDPAGQSFADLRALARHDREDPEVRRTLIEWFAFLAVDSPWKLARERCVIELGHLGRVMGLEVEPDPGGEPASVEAVRDALARMLAGVNAIRAQGVELGESQLARGLEELRALSLDRRAALSVLRAIAPLQDLGGDDPRFAPVHAYSQEVQELLIRRTLEVALRDPEPIVVAAAIRTSTKLFGEAVLGVFTAQLFEDAAIYDERVLLTVLTLLRTQGFPRAPGGGGEARQEQFRFTCAELLVEIGSQHPSGRVRLAALRALRANAEPDFAPREELWKPWWATERRQWLLRIEELRAKGAGAQP